MSWHPLLHGKMNLNLMNLGDMYRNHNLLKAQNRNIALFTFSCVIVSTAPGPGVDTCTGDGGSPLVCQDPERGLVQVTGQSATIEMERDFIDGLSASRFRYSSHGRTDKKVYIS